MNLWHRLVGGGDESISRARRPQAAAARRGAPPRQGVDWLGREPGPEAPRLIRALLWAARLFLFRLCRLQLRVSGSQHLPDGGFIAVAALHRSWIDPLLVIEALPLEPRVWFLGSGASAFDRPWKERLLRRTGGLLPVWRGSGDPAVHLRSAQAVIDNGAVLALFAEGRIGGPPDAPAPMRSGAALLCLRTGAPIVPIALCGSEELYRGKRLRVSILPATSATELLGPDWHGPPEPGTREELRTARALTAALSSRLAEAIDASYGATVDPPAAKRSWPWLTRLMR
jgi:1-acyl-sn-glycerol-3-phosphate acyltransferase